MSTKHIKRIGNPDIVILAGLVVAILFSVYIARNTRPEETTITVKTQTHPTVSTISPRSRFQSSTLPTEDVKLKHFQNSDFYRTIIDNNLFRPLGWRPPRPREPYRLIGTILPRDENTPPRAILQTTAGNKTYIVTIGENLDTHTEVVDIQPKQVTLATDGKQRTLKLPIRF